jgi:starch synthase
VAHRDVEARLCESDVFGFPSVREFGGGVVLEAMALGLVPIVADYAGPAELVTDATGFRVPMGPRAQVVSGMRKVLEQLVQDPSVIRPMGERARARVLSKFTWAKKAEQTLEVYRWVLGERDKPDFGMPFRD